MNPVAPNYPFDVEIHQAEFKHDLCKVSFQSSTVSEQGFPDGSPMYFTFGHPGSLDTFFGYVRQSRAIKQGDMDAIQVISLGATMVFSEPQSNSWTNVTADVAIQDRVRASRFVVVCPPTKREYPLLMQSNETDWEFFTRLAYENGLTFYADKTTLYFRDRLDISRRERENAFVLTYYRKGAGGNVFSFLPKTGVAPGVNVTQSIAGVDPRTAEPFFLTTDSSSSTTRDSSPIPLFMGSGKAITANTIAEARTATETQSEADRWAYKATARCLGDSILHSGKVVHITGDVDRFGGYWVVLEVIHKLVNNQYMCDLVLGSDSLGEANPIGGSKRHTTPHRVIDAEALTASAIPATVLRMNKRAISPVDNIPFVNGNGRWMADHSIPSERTFEESYGFILNAMDKVGT